MHTKEVNPEGIPYFSPGLGNPYVFSVLTCLGPGL